MKITIPGEVISKKNGQTPVRRGKKTFIIPKNAYLSYEKIAVQYCRMIKPWSGRYPVVVEIYIYRSSNRKFDFDNMQASVNDVLVKSGIIMDDSMRHVIPSVRGLGWEKCGDNPRVEIEITEYNRFCL